MHKEKKELPEDYWENHHRELERSYPEELEAVKQESIRWNNGKYDYDVFLECLDQMRGRYKEGYYSKE